MKPWNLPRPLLEEEGCTWLDYEIKKLPLLF
jgi:hypothetical protein